MDQEVAKTLAELEFKLRELESELTSIGRRSSEPQPPSVQQPPPAPTPQPGRAPAPPTGHIPAAPQPQSASAHGRLVDEAIEHRPERRYSMEAQETAFGEIPATKDEHETIDLADLVRFKEEMQNTLQGLIDEYGRLLSLRPRR